MNYEIIKEEFINLKKEEFNYIDVIAKKGCNEILSEYEKLKIYRNLKQYEQKINEAWQNLKYEVIKNENLDLDDVIVTIKLNEDFLSSVKPLKKECILEDLEIDLKTYEYKLTLMDILRRDVYHVINQNRIHNQRLIDDKVMIFCGYYDSTEDCCGPIIGDYDDHIYAIYLSASVDSENIYDSGYKKRILKKKMPDFEKDKTIIHSTKYVKSSEIKKIIKEELLNNENNSVKDCL